MSEEPQTPLQRDEEPAEDPRSKPPIALPGLLMAVLRLLGEDEPWIQETADDLEVRQKCEGQPPWPEIQHFLAKIVSHGQLTRSMWRRERELLKEVMVEVAGGFGATLGDIGQVDNQLETLAQQLRNTDNLDHIRTLKEVLLTRVEDFRTHTRELQKKLEISRAAVANSQEHMKRMDRILTETRDQQLMDTDTGLPNRYAFSGHFRRQLERAANMESPFSLAVLILAELPRILLKLGPKREARLLRSLNTQIRGELHKGDLFARIGDDRFVLLFPNSDLHAAVRKVEKIRYLLDHTRFRLVEGNLALWAFFGVVAFRPGMTESDMLYLGVRRATAAMEDDLEGERIRIDDAPPEPP
ncbi:MAG: diguanylate cyclase [Magnetococcales bacterium]|nr:diguanylate cyclase [Magnetococcales bacterium]